MKLTLLILIIIIINIVNCTGVKNLQNPPAVTNKKNTENTKKSKLDQLYLDKSTLSIANYLEFNQKLSFKNAKKYFCSEKEYNIPIYIDDRVNYYINLYSTRFASMFQKWIDRSNRYKDIIEEIFIREGLPSDLALLPFAESGFNPQAISHAKAVGMWQFIESTGKQYGLKNNFWLDERKDFIKSSKAAAKHLKDLYERFNNWYLALAAYNAGMYTVYNAIDKYNTKDFRKLSKYNYFKRETKDYIPKFIAQLLLYKNAVAYGFDNTDTDGFFFETIKLTKPINLFVVAELINREYQEIKEFNPELKRPITPPNTVYELKIPFGTKEILQTKLKKLTYSEKIQVHIYYPKKNEKLSVIANRFGVSTSEILSLNGYYYNDIYNNRPLFIPIKGVFNKRIAPKFAKAVTYDLPKIYTVKKGDTMYGISKRLGIPLKKLISYNNGINPSLIRPGDKIILPSYLGYIKTYTVKSGDSLWSIAQRFNTSVKALKKRNNLYSSNIRIGTKLIIPN
ncbi:MAG: LysM peptidoglycan-binding domain-containing protein [Deferribacterota bacterium]|nr:LysM peptidoglycan-binding domain-containing protein [Deferribacterota bacterium]